MDGKVERLEVWGRVVRHSDVGVHLSGGEGDELLMLPVLAMECVNTRGAHRGEGLLTVGAASSNSIESFLLRAMVRSEEKGVGVCGSGAEGRAQRLDTKAREEGTSRSKWRTGSHITPPYLSLFVRKISGKDETQKGDKYIGASRPVKCRLPIG